MTVSGPGLPAPSTIRFVVVSGGGVGFDVVVDVVVGDVGVPLLPPPQAVSIATVVARERRKAARDEVSRVRAAQITIAPLTTDTPGHTPARSS